MAILKVLSFPDSNRHLNTPALNVDHINSSIYEILDDMLETMYDSSGIGLAANQVGILKRLVVIDIGPEYNDKPLKMINPEIIWQSDDKSVTQEGCLSVPDQWAEVERPQTIRYRYTDEHGLLHEQEADGLLACCIQHEIDHLDGHLFFEHLSDIKRKRLLNRLLKDRRRAQFNARHDAS